MSEGLISKKKKKKKKKKKRRRKKYTSNTLDSFMIFVYEVQIAAHAE